MVVSMNENTEVKLFISGERCRHVTTDSFATEISENVWDFRVTVKSCSATQIYQLPTSENRIGIICIWYPKKYNKQWEHASFKKKAIKIIETESKAKVTTKKYFFQ